MDLRPSMSPMIELLRFRTAWPLLLVLMVGVVGCAVNPVTGQRQFVLFSESQEIQMGREADRDIVANLGLYEDEELEALIREMGARMAAGSERPDLPWTFRIVDDPTVNAFALPGGFVYFTRGILAHFTSEAELAGVLGHEIGHVTARHGITRVSRAQVAQIGLGVGMVLAPELQPFGEAAGVGLQLLFLRNSREDERQADDLGVRYMYQEGYDPRELSGVFAMLARASGAQDGDRIPGFLSTHPDPLERRDRILQQVETSGLELGATRVGRASYLRLLDGLVFGTNPREGYFEGDRFLHPELAFELRFPQGWRTVNARHQVQGVSPQEDAVLILSLSDAASAAGARDAFLRQAGLIEERRWSESVSGLPAAWGQFRITSEHATFRGVVAYVEYGERLFQLLGYSHFGVWEGRRDAVIAAVRSFGEVTDPSVLGVEPRRIEVVELPREMSLEAFLSDYPSSIPDETVAVINQLETGDVIPAGTLLKRVVGGPN